MYRLLILGLIILSHTVLAMNYDEKYAQAIDQLYKQNEPQKALALFQELESAEPSRSWATPFMCGYTLRVYLKKPAESIPYFSRAILLVKGENEDPYKNLINAHEDLKEIKTALVENQKAEKTLRNFGKKPSDWFLENRAWLFMQMGQFEKALRVAPAGSWAESQLAPRTIQITWNVRLRHSLTTWGFQEENTVRLTLPLERRFQKVMFRKIEPISGIKISYPMRAGVRYAKLQKATSDPWPEQITLRFHIKQFPAVGGINVRLASVGEQSPLHFFASDNGDGLFSQDNPEFMEKVANITQNGKNTTEKAILALRYLRSHFKYGPKPELSSWNAHSALEFGSGDCGYFSYISIAMLRALKIPVRNVYGLNSWNNPSPALPHAIIEIYDAGSRQWIPHDPQSDHLFGYINPDYVPFFTANPTHRSVSKATDGIVEIDTTFFFWAGSGTDTLSYEIQKHLKSGSNQNAGKDKNPDSYKPSQELPKPSTGPWRW